MQNLAFSNLSRQQNKMLRAQETLVRKVASANRMQHPVNLKVGARMPELLWHDPLSHIH